MYRLLLPIMLAACVTPALAQTVTHSGATANNNAADAAHSTRTAESITVLTLQDALSMALNANAELAAARFELAAVEASVLQANALPNPVLEMSMEDRRRETRETTFQINQPIELGGKRAARMNAAERGRDAAGAELLAKEAEIRAAVITAFFDVVAAQERSRLAEESFELARRGTYAASRRVAAGKVSPVEETKARIAESSVRLELNQAKSELISARKRLAAIWGNPTPRFEYAKGDVDALPVLPDLNELIRQLSIIPALKRARFEVERRQALVNVERSRRIPDVTVSLGVKRSEELGYNQAIVGLAIPLPLFDSNRGNVLEAQRRSDKAREEFTATEIRIQSDITQAYERLTLARQDADILKNDIVPSAQSAYEAAAKGFEFGKFGFLDVLDAQRTLLQAKSQYLRTLSEAHRAAAAVERIVGSINPAK
jgi:cobalt-zinc-cadmium efflux system outer membrane protein